MKTLTRNIQHGSIYLLFNKETLVYIGQSKNPCSRIGSHNRDKTFTHYRIMTCLKRRMNYWESLLISRYKPRYNKAGLKRSPLKQALIDHGSSEEPFIRQTPQTPRVTYSDACLRVRNPGLEIGDSTSTSGGYKFQPGPRGSYSVPGWACIGYEPQVKPTVVIGESIKILLDKVKDEQQ